MTKRLIELVVNETEGLQLKNIRIIPKALESLTSKILVEDPGL